MTSLPSDAALYHASAKLFKRSEGRSAVAAAAYRSASKLQDQRTGQTFDYTRKHCIAAFIVVPSSAPAWTNDRQELWNRAEAAEKRKDAKIAREWEISIPRDIPEDRWEAFAREVVAPYVATGAVADIAIHSPRAADGQAQPHIHVMLTLREIDTSTETGFSKTRNSALESMHAVGSRKVGPACQPSVECRPWNRPRTRTHDWRGAQKRCRQTSETRSPNRSRFEHARGSSTRKSQNLC